MGSDVTVVIPAYNASEVVANAVASCWAQTVRPDAVIVVDDGSTDDTARRAEAAGAFVIRQTNHGPGSARNAGIRATTTTWIALLDADDVSLPNRLDEQLASVDGPQTAVVCGAMTFTNGARLPVPPPPTFENLWRSNVIGTSTVLLRRQAWASAGGFDESPDLIGVEDYNLWLRLAHAGWTLRSVPIALAEYRGTQRSLTRDHRRFVEAEIANVHALARVFGVSAAALSWKEHRIYRQYGLDLFHARDFRAARKLLSAAAERAPLEWSARSRLWFATVLTGWRAL